MLAAHGATHPGKVRRQNEDRMLVQQQLGLFAVADGMGGHNAGEVASSLAVEALHSFVSHTAVDKDPTWPFGLDLTLDHNGNRLRTAVKLANLQVFSESKKRDEYAGMGTTIVAVLVDNSSAVLSGVGDSRIYSVRPGAIQQLTHDDTWVESLLSENADVDSASLVNHPMRHVLTKVIGGQDDVDVTVTSRQLAPDERLVLCTDGVHGALDDAEIAGIVSSAPDVQAAAERLVARALEEDGRDNITALVLGVSEA